MVKILWQPKVVLVAAADSMVILFYG